VNIVLVGAPRSGAGLFHSILGAANGWRSSDLSQPNALDEALAVDLAERDFASHRIHPEEVGERIGAIAELDGVRGESGSVSVDWNPRLSLRVGLLAQALPDARFVLVTRRPVPAISSSMDAWRSGRFVSVPDLPGWWGEPWSFPLVEGWRGLIGAPPARVCSAQWSAITTAVLDDLGSLDASRWTVASYEGLLADAEAEIGGLVNRLGVPWDGDVPDPLPVTSSAVTVPDPGKWVRNSSEIAAFMSDVEPVAERLRSMASARRPDLPWPDLEAPKREEEVSTHSSSGTPFESSHTPSVAELLKQAGVSLLVTTYKSGHAIIARHDEGIVNTEFKNVSRAMGAAVAGNRLAIGGADAILAFTNQQGLAARAPSPKPADAAYAPRSVVFTGDVAIHDMAYGGDGALYFVNTRFSCLSRQDIDYSFVPVWRPSWISALAGEDRCHLNGLAMVDGQPRYVTALAQTDTAGGWRELKGTSGVIVDVTDDRVVCSGLAMPHSPRWHDGRLWVLESGTGALSTVDVDTGDVSAVAHLPGFTRGLDFIGPYALVGLSQVRESVFTDLPITQQAAERNCGVWVVDTRNGEIVGFLRFAGAVQEIFDVKVLPARWPTILDSGELTLSAFVLPDEALKVVVAESPGDNAGDDALEDK